MSKDDFKSLLLQKKQQLESTLKEIKQDDLLLDEATREIEQMAAAANEVERNNKMLIIKRNIEEMLRKINRALQRIRDNTYGVCERCKQYINTERLQAIPTTSLCIACIAVVQQYQY